MGHTNVTVFQLSEHWGGIETYLLNILMPALNDNKITLMSTTDKPFILERFQRFDCNIAKLPAFRNPLLYIKQIIKCTRNADIIYFNKNSALNILPILISRLTSNATIVIHAHNTQPSSRSIIKFLHYAMRTLLNKCVDIRLACSELAASYLFGKRYAHDCLIVNNGINVAHFGYDPNARQALRKKFHINKNTLVVGNIARFTEQKNQIFLIDTFAKLHIYHPDSKLILIGDGPLKKTLKQRCKMLNLDEAVIFTGPQADTASLYSLMDIFLLPSIYEGLPIVLVEAQASGLPILASDRVDKEIAMTDLIDFLPITPSDNSNQKSTDCSDWAHAALKTLNNKQTSDRTQYAEYVRKNGFDISTNINKIQKALKNCR